MKWILETHDQINQWETRTFKQDGIYIWISHVFFLKIEYSIQINGITVQKQKSESNICFKYLKGIKYSCSWGTYTHIHRKTKVYEYQSLQGVLRWIKPIMYR